MGLKSGERKADKIGSEEKASKGEEVGERGVVGVAAVTAFLKVAVRWSGDLEMAGEAMVERWCDLPLITPATTYIKLSRFKTDH